MTKLGDVQTVINQKQVAPADRFNDLLNRIDIQKKFKDMLKEKAPGFLSSLMSLRNSNNYLKAAEPMSIISSAAIAASLDLPINPNLGFAHIVPYAGVATFQMGWKGFVQLAIRTGQYKTMNAAEIYEGELIKYDRVKGETEIDADRKKSDKVVGYVAYFRLTSGFEKYLYMTVDQVTDHAKRYSQAYKQGKKDSPWFNNFDAMAKKTVLKLLLSKFGILSIEMQRALEFDQASVKMNSQGEQVPEYIDGEIVNDALEPAPEEIKAKEPIA